MRPVNSASIAPSEPSEPSPQLPTLALDIGGSTTRIGSFSAPAALAEYTLLATFPTAADYTEQLARLADELTSTGTHAGIGVSFGGRITRDGQRVAVAPNLPDYEGKPLVDDLTRLCGGPVRLAHDPVCGLLAERRFGVLAGAGRCAYLTVSTGTGAALHLANGEPTAGSEDKATMHPGSRGVTLSIEIGHQIIAERPSDERPRQCLCGQVGCLETYTGGKQLALRYGRPLQEIDDPDVWRDLTEMLAIGLVNLAQLARIERVAVSGGIALHRDGLVAEVQRAVDRRLHGATLRLERARLGERAPLVGAALLLTTTEEGLLH